MAAWPTSRCAAIASFSAYLPRYVNESEFEPATPLTCTVTGTVIPCAPDGVTAEQLVVLLQLTPVAWVPPKKKMVAPATVEKPLPVIVTVVPPLGFPDVGLIELRDGT